MDLSTLLRIRHCLTFRRIKAPGIVRFFTEHSFRYIGAAPEKWNRDVPQGMLPRDLAQKNVG